MTTQGNASIRGRQEQRFIDERENVYPALGMIVWCSRVTRRLF